MSNHVPSPDPPITPSGEAAVKPFVETPAPSTPVGSFYRQAESEWTQHPVIIKDSGEEVTVGPTGKKGVTSIFNRYSVFFFNNVAGGDSTTGEGYLDTPGRIHDDKLQEIRYNPTASNLVSWTKQGNTNAVEYSAEDFLWAKKFKQVPNNYLVTLRRFPQPCSDDLFSSLKNKLPDVGRLLTWVDGEDVKWDNVGLKWNHSMNWKDLEADIQVMQASQGAGNETGAIGGGIGKALQSMASISDTGASNAARSSNPNTSGINPYGNKNVIFGPIDVIRNQKIRDKGLKFEQKFDLKFEYELRSIDGINPKIAFIDLLSNILVVTANKGSFWGGERRFYGGNPRQVKPFGDTGMLANGDYKGYMDSLMSGLTAKVDQLSGGKGFSIPEGVGNMLKSLGGNLMSQLTGGALDKMGRQGGQAMDSLLTGEDTGEWHVMVGNPANPIISVGNLALTKTEVSLSGALGPDDFPTKIMVTCSLEPARPRDRLDMMAMFSRNARTYLTKAPQAISYTKDFKGQPTKKGSSIGASQEKQIAFPIDGMQSEQQMGVFSRFPNHTSAGNGSSELVEAAGNLVE